MTAEGRCEGHTAAGKMDAASGCSILCEGHAGVPVEGRQIMIWARRLVFGAGLAVASVVVVPGLAGAAATNCPTTPGATVTPSGGGPSPTCPVVVPTVAGNSTTPGTAAATSALPNTGSGVAGSSGGSGTSSLPFTGADVDELAVIGGAALLAGGLLMWRRRTVRA